MSYWNEKIAVITGGTAGLGLALAHAFGSRGARPFLLGRDANRLHSALSRLRSAGIESDGTTADVLDDARMAAVVEDIIDRFGRIDVWVNNVGRSTRVELMQASADEYRELLEVNFLSAVRCTRLVLPHLARASGHLVNVGSLSSRVAWPYLGPYTTSKFALAGFAQQLRIEGPKNVHFLLACPGPISRDDAGVRYQSDGVELPGHALKPGAGARLNGLSVDAVARGIVRACEKKKLELIMPYRVRLLFLIHAVSPRLADWILRRWMPASAR